MEMVYHMDKTTETKTEFGLPAETLCAFCNRDAILKELVYDYRALSRELRNLPEGRDGSDAQYWSDSLDTLHALNDEIKERVTRLL